MNDMNESGVGISHPGNSIWKNGRQIQLDGVLHGSGWENIQVEQINRNGTLLGSASRTGGNGDIVPVLLKELHVEDNTDDATGVDNVSMTVETTDPGYQQDIWIMAPLQGPEPFDYENRAKFKVGGKDRPSMGAGTLSAANATPIPNQLTVNGKFQHIDWRGTGDGIDSEEPVHFQLGSSINGNLPVRVKAMKYRKVKLRVCLVAKDLGGGASVNPDPDLVPTKAELEAYLNPLFAYQLNTWFEVTIDRDDTKLVNFGPDFEVANPHSPDQILAYDSFQDHGQYHMQVFIVGKNGFFTGDPGANTVGFASRANNTCWILGSPQAGHNSEPIIMATIGHEIGHIFFGRGHPDEPVIGDSGPAPLRGTDHTKRLMASGKIFNSNSRLIVKKEWDEAEVWLKAREQILSMEP